MEGQTHQLRLDHTDALPALETKVWTARTRAQVHSCAESPAPLQACDFTLQHAGLTCGSQAARGPQ